MAKLGDLPKEVEAKAKTEKELRAENAALRTQLLAASRQTKTAPVLAQAAAALSRTVTKEVVKEVKVKVEVPVITETQMKRLEQMSKSAIHRTDVLAQHFKEIKQLAEKGMGQNERLFAKRQDARIAEAHDAFGRAKTPPLQIKNTPPIYHRKPPPLMEYGQLPPVHRNGEDGGTAAGALLAGERKMLGVLAQFHPGSRTKSQLGALAGYKPSGGTFGQYYGKLRRLKLLQERSDGGISITEAGLEWFGGEIPEGPKSSKELLDMWRGKLLQGERKMLNILVEAGGAAMTKEELGERSGYTSSGGTFGQYLGTLRRNGLVLIESDSVRAAETLFDLSAGVA